MFPELELAPIFYIWLIVVIFIAKETIEDGIQLFDDQVTQSDRNMLMRLNFFGIQPILTAFHECGHAAVILFFGGSVSKVGYGVWSGFVTPVGDFSNLQHLLIDSAGSLVEIVIAFIFLLLAVIEKSPAMVTFWVYAAIFDLGFSLILYPILSFVEKGDFKRMYLKSDPQYVPVVAAVHIGLLLLLLFLMRSPITRKWYHSKTNPEWVEIETKAKEAASKNPTPENFCKLAMLYNAIKDFCEARKYLNQALEKDPDFHLAKIILGQIELEKNFPTKASILFEEVIDKSDNPLIRAYALTSLAEALIEKNRGEDSLNKSLEYLDQAIDLAPGYGDPLFTKALTLAAFSRKDEALELLSELMVHSNSLNWFNPARVHDILPELNSLHSGRR